MKKGKSASFCLTSPFNVTTLIYIALYTSIIKGRSGILQALSQIYSLCESDPGLLSLSSTGQGEETGEERGEGTGGDGRGCGGDARGCGRRRVQTGVTGTSEVTSLTSTKQEYWRRSREREAGNKSLPWIHTTAVCE